MQHIQKDRPGATHTEEHKYAHEDVFEHGPHNSAVRDAHAESERLKPFHESGIPGEGAERQGGVMGSRVERGRR